MTILATSEILSDLIQGRRTFCPFFENNPTVCGASSLIILDKNRKKKYCHSEDYEDCPIFLVKRLNGKV
ncbi:MAG TPA: hypothetical protein HPP56_03825 [Nitrospirae bacterium]|nr:hypothetical protein [Nitrospirota bacterium]